MCILVWYVSPSSKKIKTQLLELLPLDAKDCSARKIFETFKNFLEDKNIPIKNIIGMACDNASVMTGCNNSFTTYLKLEVPDLITLNCICHSSALIANKVKRCAILVEFQDFFEVERNKIKEIK